MTKPRRACWLLAGLIALGSPRLAGAAPPELRMEPARTRVGLATVNLLVSDLRLNEDALVGRYEIRVPLAPWMNDRGEIRLEAPAPLENVISGGGTASGTGHSVLDGRTHSITCAFEPDGTVQILVDTDRRDLAFKTQYHLKLNQ